MNRRRRDIIVLLLIVAQCSGCATAPVTPPTPIAPPVPPPITTTGANGQTVVVQPPSPNQCCPHPTIWQFLGLKGLCDAIKGLLGRLRSRLGMLFPGLEAKPPLLEITDPANLASDNPAIKTAAGVKGEEDAAEQKIKALRYLATIGCGGCYPDVQDAMLAALDDCTEEVRYEAVKALRETTGKPCAKCKTIACCSEKVRKRLQEVATAKDDKGCYKESSSRVRRLARLAMAGCGGPPLPETPETQDMPLEGPSEEPVEPTASSAEDSDEQIASDQTPTLAKPQDNDKPAAETAEKKSDAAGDKVTASEPTPAKSGATPAQTVSQQKSSVVVVNPHPPGCNCGADHSQTPTVQVYNTPAAPAKSGTAKPAATPHKAAPAAAKPGPNLKETGSATIYPPDATEKARVTRISATLPDPSFKTAASDDEADVWAKVNGEAIYEHEIQQQVEKQFARVATSLDPAVHPDVRRSLSEREVRRAVDRKLLCQEARRAMPSAEIQRVSFTDPALKGDPAFDTKAGSAASEEEALAANWLARHVQVSEAITVDELKARYQLFVLQGQGLEQTRGEQLTAHFQRFGSKQEAYATISHLRSLAMGLNPTPPEKLRLNLVELTKHDWKRRDQLPAGPVGEAMPRLSVGAVSPVLEDAAGYHIVRVLERRKGDAPPLESVTAQLRQEILAARRTAQQKAYLDQLRAEARIWTIFDPPTPKGRLISVKPVTQE